MNEENEELLELLRVMKDLQVNGFHLSKEINAIIKLLLTSYGFSYEDVYGNNLTKYSNSDLVKELSIRTDVEKYEIEPHGGKGKLIIDNFKEGSNTPIDGAAVVLIIKD